MQAKIRNEKIEGVSFFDSLSRYRHNGLASLSMISLLVNLFFVISKKLNFLTQNGPKKGASPQIYCSNIA